MIEIGSVVFEIWPDNVKSWGRIYAGRCVYLTKYSNLRSEISRQMELNSPLSEKLEMVKEVVLGGSNQFHILLISRVGWSKHPINYEKNVRFFKIP